MAEDKKTETKEAASGENQPVNNAGKKDQTLIDAACEAYGIGKEFLLGARVDQETGEAVLVTHGGKKVRYAKGSKVDKLTQVEVTGINPGAEKRKPIAGKKKQARDDA